jgi:hypothetical protein
VGGPAGGGFKMLATLGAAKIASDAIRPKRSLDPQDSMHYSLCSPGVAFVWRDFILAWPR